MKAWRWWVVVAAAGALAGACSETDTYGPGTGLSGGSAGTGGTATGTAAAGTGGTGATPSGGTGGDAGSAAAGAGGGQGGPCDVGDCSACGASDCAYDACEVALGACTSDSACLALSGCLDGCQTPACEYDCHTDHAAGASEYYALLNCLYCDAGTCAVDCADYCPMTAPPEPPCNVDDCYACADSDCTYFWCSVELDACFDDAGCQSFMNCQDACGSDPTCIRGCHSSHPTGADLYYEVLNCLYCDANTCSVDCVDDCPVLPPADPPCNQGDCGDCGSSDCSYFWCGLELEACLDDSSCLAFEGCSDACDYDPACEYGCQSTYATGSTLYYGLLNCLYCDTDTCSVDCVDYCPMTPVPDPPCEQYQTDCDLCADSDCTYRWCTVELDACFGDQDCLDFMDCQDACTTAACIQACHGSHPTGATLYYATINCLYCDTNTCAQGCADYCPMVPPTGPCDSGNCQTCVNSSCAATECAYEIQACNANPACVGLRSCYAGCSNPGCRNQCENTWAAGIADYQAMMACLFCSPWTCSVDCAAYCN